MTTILIHVKEDFKKMLKSSAALQGMTMTKLIQVAVKEYLKNHP